MASKFKIPFKQVGQTGIIRDIARDELPDGTDSKIVWTSGENVRFYNGLVEKCYGSVEVLPSCPVPPYHLNIVNTNGNRSYIVAGLQKIYLFSSSTWTNVTRQTTGVDVNYTGSTSDIWTGGLLNGIPIVNNGVDTPQFLSPVNTSTKFKELTGWQSNYKAACVRTFLNFIVALDITKGSGTRYPNMVKWSDFASFGTIPTSWDETLPSGSAREAEIGSSDDAVIDCLPLGEVNVIYKNNSTWTMRLNPNSEEVFHIAPLFQESGILAKRCVAAIPNGHVVLTTNDVIFHDGSTYKSIINAANRKWLFQQIDNTQYYRAQVVHNPIFSEVWICFPTLNNIWINKALIWNYNENTWGVRDLPNVNEVVSTQFATTSGNIDGLTNPINDYNVPVDVMGSPISLGLFNDAATKLITVTPTTTKFTAMDSSVSTDLGTVFQSNVVRENLWLGDLTTYKTVTTIYPRAEIIGESPTLDCYVGVSNQVGQPVKWFGPYTFKNTDYKIDIPFISGRLISIKFQSNINVSWKINGFDVEFVVNGKY